MPKSRKPSRGNVRRRRSPPASDRIQQVIRQVQDGIAEHGWYAIATADGGDKGFSFTYTVGMQATWGVPDLVIVGMPYPTAKSYLNKAAAAAKAGKDVVQDGHLPGYFGDFDGWAIRVSADEFDERFRISRVLYPELGAGLQILFPDANGRFPWDPACAYYGKGLLLGPPPIHN